MSVKPLKSLGQNFLTDENIILDIIEALDIQDNDNIMEIGPGTGALTKHLINKDINFFAVEKDTRAFNYLKNMYPNLFIYNQDILQFDYSNIENNVKIIGNLPYYITSLIISDVLKIHKKVKKAVFTVQKEVAERIVSDPNSKNFGILSVAVQLYSRPKLLFNIPPHAFDPPPKVTSSVITLDFYEEPVYKNPEDLMKFVNACFSQRRKKLSNSIKNYLNQNKKSLDDIKSSNFAELLDKRAENLSIKDFIGLYEFINFGIV